jgi:hypothetical protein
MASELEQEFLKELEHIVEQHAAGSTRTRSKGISNLDELARALSRVQELIEAGSISEAKELLRSSSEVFEELTASGESDTIDIPRLKLQFAILKAQATRMVGS